MRAQFYRDLGDELGRAAKECIDEAKSLLEAQSRCYNRAQEMEKFRVIDGKKENTRATQEKTLETDQ